MAEARHEFVARQLRSLITSGELAVGQSLPSESALCTQYEVSRGPMRQALASLSAEGRAALEAYAAAQPDSPRAHLDRSRS